MVSKALKKKTIFCLVQFKAVAYKELPRVYLAKPDDISHWLHAAAAGRGDTILYERHEWTGRVKSAGTVDIIPSQWQFSQERLADLASEVG